MTFVKVSSLINTDIYTSIYSVVGSRQLKLLTAATFLWDLHEAAAVTETEFNLCVYFPQLNSLCESFSLMILTICSSCWGLTLTFHLLTSSSSYTIPVPLLLYSVSGVKLIISACAGVEGSRWFELTWWFGSSLQSCLEFSSFFLTWLICLHFHVSFSFWGMSILVVKMPVSDHKITLKMYFVLLTWVKIQLAGPPKGFVRQTRGFIKVLLSAW